MKFGTEWLLLVVCRDEMSVVSVLSSGEKGCDGGSRGDERLVESSDGGVERKEEEPVEGEEEIRHNVHEHQDPVTRKMLQLAHGLHKAGILLSPQSEWGRRWPLIITMAGVQYWQGAQELSNLSLCKQWSCIRPALCCRAYLLVLSYGDAK